MARPQSAQLVALRLVRELPRRLLPLGRGELFDLLDPGRGEAAHWNPRGGSGIRATEKNALEVSK